MNPKYIRYGRLLLREHELALKSRAIRKQVEKELPAGFYSCVAYGDNGIVITIQLAEYLTLNPTAKPTVFLHERSDFNPETYARLEYPAFPMGELTTGKWLWVKADSEKFTPPTLTKPTAALEPEPQTA